MLRSYTPEEFLAAAQVGTIWCIVWRRHLSHEFTLLRITDIHRERLTYEFHHYLGYYARGTHSVRDFCRYWLAQREESDWLLATLTGEVSHVHVS